VPLLAALAAALARVATVTILAPSNSRTVVSRSVVPACKLNLEPPAAARARSASGRGCAWSEDRVVLDLDALPRCNCAEPRRSTPPWSSLYVHCSPPQRHHPLKSDSHCDADMAGLAVSGPAAAHACARF
jgi:hypothetical protein